MTHLGVKHIMLELSTQNLSGRSYILLLQGEPVSRYDLIRWRQKIAIHFCFWGKPPSGALGDLTNGSIQIYDYVFIYLLIY